MSDICVDPPAEATYFHDRVTFRWDNPPTEVILDLRRHNAAILRKAAKHIADFPEADDWVVEELDRMADELEGQ